MSGFNVRFLQTQRSELITLGGEAAVRGKYKDVGTAAVAVLIGYLGPALRGECGSMCWSVSVCDGKAGEGRRETSHQECSAPLEHTTRSNTSLQKKREIRRERE